MKTSILNQKYFRLSTTIVHIFFDTLYWCSRMYFPIFKVLPSMLPLSSTSITPLWPLPFCQCWHSGCYTHCWAATSCSFIKASTAMQRNTPFARTAPLHVSVTENMHTYIHAYIFDHLIFSFFLYSKSSTSETI